MRTSSGLHNAVSLAEKVEEIVARIPVTAKLQGLAALVDTLRAEQPERWRMKVSHRRAEQPVLRGLVHRLQKKFFI